jgi:carbamate kinase
LTRSALAVLALGGNALITTDQVGTQREQLRNARRAAGAIVTLARSGFRVLVVHGNGPQVGRELLRNEESSTKIPPHSLDVCVAATQGTMGFLLALETANALRRVQLKTPVSPVMTQVLINPEDAAFQNPTKPIGPFYNNWRAKALMKTEGVHMVEDAGRGWRRVVASPPPLEVLNLDSVEALLSAGHIVIAGGGGGVPVAVDPKGQLTGVEAVVDKDRTAAMLAGDLGAELLVLLTGVDQIYANFGRTDQSPLERVSVVELRALYEAGQFPPGSMGPKVESALEFVEDGGVQAIITSAAKFAAALADRAGTRIAAVADEGAPMRRQISLFPPLSDDENDDDDA